ncbi:MAG: glycosyltransferase [Acidobacteria bacterium]|nr:glycosyltransferase [Acidobacteriota bacterium]MCB9377509.1 glycosyltransferase [Holophagales bacterium]
MTAATPTLGVVWVHYRTPDLVPPSVASVREELERSALSARLLLVDNGSTESDRSAWADLPVERLAPGENLGYAGALTLALERLETPFVVVLNPDVFVQPGCLSRLVAALERGAAAAGPRFVWDAAGRVALPPTEERSRAAELHAALARRAPFFAHIARRRWRRHARRHWTATAPVASRSLSGALLAFRRDAWERVGPFDAAYRLYFEETDWLLRVARARLETIYDPGAQALHLYAQSSLGEPATAGWFADSTRRFRRRAYGPTFASLLAKVERATPSVPQGAVALERPEIAASELPDRPHWIEISPSPIGLPAAAEQRPDGDGDWRFPDDVWRRLPPGPCWVRVVDRHERRLYRLEKGGA